MNSLALFMIMTRFLTLSDRFRKLGKPTPRTPENDGDKISPRQTLVYGNVHMDTVFVFFSDAHPESETPKIIYFI